MTPLSPVEFAAWIVSALLAAVPAWPARDAVARTRAEVRALAIVRACEAEGATRRMCLAAVAECFVESGLRARRHGASLCGCRPYATDDRTQALCAVRSVARALSVCATADEASLRYVGGQCRLAPSTPRPWRAHATEHVRGARLVLSRLLRFPRAAR